MRLLLSHYTFVLLICSLFPGAWDVHAQSVCPDDSTVVYTFYGNEDGGESPIIGDTIRYVFRRDSGICYEYHGFGDTTLYSTSYFTLPTTTYLPNGQISEILSRTGSSTGLVNSSLTKYTYSPSGKLAEELNLTWNGSGWDSSEVDRYSYNAADSLVIHSASRWTNAQRLEYKRIEWTYQTNLLTNTAYFSLDAGGVNLRNDSSLAKTYDASGAMISQSFSKYDTSISALRLMWRRDFTYTGTGNYASKLFSSYHPPITGLRLDSLYEYSYSGTTRDSVRISYWDSVGNQLQFFGAYAYQSSYFELIKYSSDQHSGYVDTITYVLDTAERMLSRRIIDLTSLTTCNYDYREWVVGSNQMLLSFENSADLYGYTDTDGSWRWASYDRTPWEKYYYDSLDRMVRREWQSGCTNRCRGFVDYSYRPYVNGQPFYVETMNFDLGANSSFRIITLTYYTNSVLVIMPPVTNDFQVCDSVFQPVFYFLGGCGPYQFRWSSSVGPLTDTTLSPILPFNGTVTTYTVHITDSRGNQDSLEYRVRPAIERSVAITDSSCSNRIQLTAGQAGANSYQWFKDGVLLSGEQSRQLTAESSGNYFVVIDQYYRAADGNYYNCQQSSDTVAVTVTPIESQQAAVICLGEDFMLPDSTLVTSAGQYRTVVSTAHGCDSVIVTDLTVRPAPAMWVTNSTIRCHGDSSYVVLSAQGGTPPYAGIDSGYYHPGTYSFQITDQNGCTASSTLSLVEPDLLVADAGFTVIDTCLEVGLGLPVELGGQPSGTGGTQPYWYNWYADGIIVGSVPNFTYYTTVSQTFTLEVWDSYGCQTRDTAKVIVRNYLQNTISGVNDSLYAVLPGTSYTWYDANLQAFPDTTPYFHPTVSGLYYVEVEYANGCSDLSDPYAFLLTSTPEIRSGNVPFIYPQPVTDKLTVNGLGERAWEVRLYGLDGRLLRQAQGVSAEWVMDVQEFASGCYMLWVLQEERAYRMKVVKE